MYSLSKNKSGSQSTAAENVLTDIKSNKNRIVKLAYKAYAVLMDLLWIPRHSCYSCIRICSYTYLE